MKVEGDSLKLLSGKSAHFQPTFMHPAVFVGLSVLLGVLFALQECVRQRVWNYHIKVSLVVSAWGLQYFLWGVLCWILWWWLRPSIQRATFGWMLTRMLPLSILASIAEEMIWVVFFPNLPLDRPPMDYWHRFAFQLNGEAFENILIFWCAIALFRGIGYYQKFRDKERAAAQLETQLANAKIAALRMQLNPHFLFNAMNSISSLMRIDIDAADTMLEQLGSLLRITLQRGDAQFVSLHDEMEFIELYLAMQERRYGSRVHQSIKVDPKTHDALVPAMILQPIVENAYVHGLSHLDRGGILAIETHHEGDRIRLTVLNSGHGLYAGTGNNHLGQGVGLKNIKNRLQMHYGMEHTFELREISPESVQVTLTIPFRLS